MEESEEQSFDEGCENLMDVSKLGCNHPVYPCWEAHSKPVTCYGGPIMHGGKYCCPPAASVHAAHGGHHGSTHQGSTVNHTHIYARSTGAHNAHHLAHHTHHRSSADASECPNLDNPGKVPCNYPGHPCWEAHSHPVTCPPGRDKGPKLKGGMYCCAPA